MCDSNKFMQRKRVGSVPYYWNCAILHQTISIMFPGINLLLLLCTTNTYRAGLSRKLVKIGGSSEPLEPPLVMGLNTSD